MTRDNIVEVKSGDEHGPEPPTGGWSYRPRTDITEDNDEFTVFAEMPGVSPDDLDVSFEDATLTIRGMVTPRQDEDTEYLKHEYGVGGFHRELVLTDGIDAERITAAYENGVLTVHLPKPESAKPRRIPVRTVNE